MTFRQDILKIIQSKASANEKSLMITVYLESHAGLNLLESGHIDHDAEAKEALFSNDYGLSEKIKSILS